jgi:anti-anti-sigma factor
MDADDEFSLAVEHDGRGSVVRILGELDLATAPRLRRCLMELDGSSVTLDFSGVTFMDSGGVAVVAWAMKRARQDGSGFHIHGVQPAQMRVFELTGMAAELPLDGDL